MCSQRGILKKSNKFIIIIILLTTSAFTMQIVHSVCYVGLFC